MPEFHLSQKIDEHLFNKIILNENKDEIDKAFNEWLSDENKNKIRKYLYDELSFKCHELRKLYDAVMGHLLSEIGLSFKCHELRKLYDTVMGHLRDEIEFCDENIGPNRILNPNEDDSKYIELYLLADCFDKVLTKYDVFLESNKSEQRILSSKTKSAKERLEKVNVKIENAGQRLKEIAKSKESSLEEKTKLESTLERDENEIERIKEQIETMQKRLDELPSKLEQYFSENHIGSLYNKVYTAAQKLNLENLLELNLKQEDDDFDFTLNNEFLMRKIKEIDFNFEIYEKPKTPIPERKISRKIKYLTAGFATAAILILGYFFLPREKVQDKKYHTPEMGFRQTFVQRIPEIEKRAPEPEHVVKIKVPDPQIIFFRNKKYLPTTTSIESFNPEKKEVSIKWKWGDLVHTQSAVLPVHPIFFKDKYPDVVTLSYRKESDKVIEIQNFYALGSEGTIKETEHKERPVSEKEMKEYLREYLKDYKLCPIEDARIHVKSGDLADGKYLAHKNIIEFTTLQGADIPLSLDQLGKSIILTDIEHDKIPECTISFNNSKYYFMDINAGGFIKWIKPPEGRSLHDHQILQLTKVEFLGYDDRK